MVSIMRITGLSPLKANTFLGFAPTRKPVSSKNHTGIISSSNTFKSFLNTSTSSFFCLVGQGRGTKRLTFILLRVQHRLLCLQQLYTSSFKKLCAPFMVNLFFYLSCFFISSATASLCSFRNFLGPPLPGFLLNFFIPPLFHL